MIMHAKTGTQLKHLLPLRTDEYPRENIVTSLKNVKTKLVRVGNYLGIPPNQIEINL